MFTFALTSELCFHFNKKYCFEELNSLVIMSGIGEKRNRENVNNNYSHNVQHKGSLETINQPIKTLESNEKLISVHGSTVSRVTILSNFVLISGCYVELFFRLAAINKSIFTDIKERPLRSLCGILQPTTK